jgi:DNA invertase Pin-like site-specific DNA recombinase
MASAIQATAAAYIRMSTDDQQNSPARQRADINALAELMGFVVILWYEDHGRTGTESRKRSGFQQMLKDAKSGKFQVLLLGEQSRMSREDMFAQMDHWRLLRDAGVKVFTCQQGN